MKIKNVQAIAIVAGTVAFGIYIVASFLNDAFSDIIRQDERRVTQ